MGYLTKDAILPHIGQVFRLGDGHSCVIWARQRSWMFGKEKKNNVQYQLVSFNTDGELDSAKGILYK
jgi:hypothetical protein